MAIPATMNIDEEKNNKGGGDDDDGHEHDVVMPGFRFYPTEEELVEFYLRRKVEGKRFNVELITLLDLYRYDPWELPALATIGEKEWYFYVPRDRKYRNGDRPNRVTTSGYWKATGADRMIRGENSRSIGLKKTLVFYTGKAPKGIRTSWIMNEYRLPHHETGFYHKAEISLCRVYKRAGVGDYSNPNPHLPPRSLPTTRVSSSGSTSRDVNNRQKQAAVQQQRVFTSNLDDALKGSQLMLPPPHHYRHHVTGQMNEVKTDNCYHHGEGSSSSGAALSLIPGHHPVNPNYRSTGPDNYENYDHPAAVIAPVGVPPVVEAWEHRAPPKAALTQQRLSSSSSASITSAALQDDLHRLVNYYTTHHHPSSHQPSASLMPPELQLQLPPQHQQLGVSSSAPQQPSVAVSFYERIPWDWNPAVPNQDYNPHHPPNNNNNPFK